MQGASLQAAGSVTRLPSGNLVCQLDRSLHANTQSPHSDLLLVTSCQLKIPAPPHRFTLRCPILCLSPLHPANTSSGSSGHPRTSSIVWCHRLCSGVPPKTLVSAPVGGRIRQGCNLTTRVNLHQPPTRSENDYHGKLGIECPAWRVACHVNNSNVGASALRCTSGRGIWRVRGRIPTHFTRYQRSVTGNYSQTNA